jgi:peptidoglycan hydrolase-like protein with peptidoglycan-binding domain
MPSRAIMRCRRPNKGDGNVIARPIAVPTIASFLLAAMAGIAPAQNSGRTPSQPGASVYFVGIKDGDTLPSKPTIHFGLRNMGLAPAGVERDNSGHHHLIIDAATPPLDRPIPNDFNHLHFGAGQSEAEITLTPGKHTLQLLLGDKDHIPHNPPVMSDRITVTVADAGQGAAVAGRHPSAPDARVYIANITDGQYIPANAVVRFGLLNMGVAPAGVSKVNTGHHHLLVDTPLPPLDKPIPNDFNHLHFGAGQTEARVTLSPGPHKLQLLFGDENHVPHDPPLVSEPISVVVAAIEGRPTLRRGSQGSPVRGVQGLLSVTVDGNFGQETEQAVRTFQGQQNIKVDGVIGPQTWGAIDKLGIAGGE